MNPEADYEGLLTELWADESVRAAVGEGDPKGLYARIEAALRRERGR